MSEFSAFFKKALLDLVRKYDTTSSWERDPLTGVREFVTEHPDPVEIVSYEEVGHATGGCETCYYEWTEVEIVYKTSDGETRTYCYSGTFADLIRELTRT